MAPQETRRPTEPEPCTIKPYRRNWAVYRPDGALLCVTVYKRGALAVAEEINRLTASS